MKVLSGSVHLTLGNYVTAITEKTKTLNNHNIARLFRASSNTNGNLKFILQKEKKNACLHRNWEAHS